MASHNNNHGENAASPEAQRFLVPPPQNGITITTDDNSGVAVVAPSKKRIPFGIAALRKCIPPLRRAPITFYQFYILGITYVLYVFYHISRKPLSVVKNVLHRQNCSVFTAPEDYLIPEDRLHNWCSWEPFEDDKTYKNLYGWMDFTYLMAYAIAMFFVGAVAERCNLRYFLTLGMIAAGALTVLFGMARFWDIHHLAFFFAVQLIGGALQATGFPAAVALVGNWFGKQRRGLIFGFWNSHASFGNILGSLLASVWVESNWGISFIVPGFTIVAGGIIAFLFIIVEPQDAGFPRQNGPAPVEAQPAIVINKNGSHELSQFLPKDSAAQIQNVAPIVVEVVEDTPLKFWQAFMIPGVIEYALCMFFAKGVAYTFLVWLPVYIKMTLAGSGNAGAGYMSTFFDIGGIVGGILVGAISDLWGARGLISGVLMFIAVPIMGLLLMFGHHSYAVLGVLLVLTGLITVGPYSIIATAVAADLGTSLKGKSKAVASVSGIINGMGSFGAAFGPLIAGAISTAASRFDPETGKKTYEGWNEVFYFLISAQFFASLCLSRLIFREIVRMRNSRRNPAAI
ncbi:Glucose-6-phosphate [Hypsibius exemplaris]|uniref:Glucose-6-phosphate n=1 Tax=Hypsibius exemplaris TaxID=2072580 RepID=A0A1W0WXB9_HYPEX|nr:Glucose-6-phosphate [Hypsibius exemplaris]